MNNLARINVAKIRDADVIAAVCEGGQTCVQIFFFRQGRNLGTASFFLAHTDGSSLEDQIAAFLTQFYQERSPAPTVLLSHPGGLDFVSFRASEALQNLRTQDD